MSDPIRVQFVCLGNICRSPMAEALARAEAEERGLGDLEVRSAGTMASSGSPASGGAVRVAEEAGLDLTSHASSEVTPELLAWADLVVCMAPSHGMDVAQLDPDVPTVLVTDFLPEDHELHGRPVADPVGGGLGLYRRTLAQLREAVQGLVARLAAG